MVDGDPKFEFIAPKVAYPAKLFALFWLVGSKTDVDIDPLFADCFYKFFSLRTCRLVLEDTFTNDPDPIYSPLLIICIFLRVP